MTSSPLRISVALKLRLTQESRSLPLPDHLTLPSCCGDSQLGNWGMFQRLLLSKGINVENAEPFSAFNISLTFLECSLIFTTERKSEDTYRSNVLIFFFSSTSNKFPRSEKGWTFLFAPYHIFSLHSLSSDGAQSPHHSVSSEHIFYSLKGEQRLYGT